MATLPESERQAMGRRAAEVVSHWGPARFARGTIEALNMAKAQARHVGGPAARLPSNT
jgi:hypothetical protein